MQYILQYIKNISFLGMVKYFEMPGLSGQEATKTTDQFYDYLLTPEAKAEAKNTQDKTRLLGSMLLLQNRVNLRDGLDAVEIKAIQYLTTKILSLKGLPILDGLIDGLAGNNTRLDIQTASEIPFVNGRITQEHIDALIAKGNQLLDGAIEQQVITEEKVDIEEVSNIPEEESKILDTYKTSLDAMEKFEKRVIEIKKGDNLSVVLKKTGFSIEEVKDILIGMKDKIPDFDINKIFIGDVFTFTNPEGQSSSFSVTVMRKDKPDQIVTLAGGKFTSGEELDEKIATYSEGEDL